MARYTTQTALLLLATASLLLVTAQQCIPSAIHTFYGFPTNNASNSIAYNCGRGSVAQGTGSYDYPLTFATSPGEFAPCEVIYSSYLRKYLINEDICVQCSVDWDDGNGDWHVEVWDMACEDGGDDEVKCGNALMPVVQGEEIVRYPVATMEVQEGALYEYGGNPSCRTDRVFPGSS